MAEKEFLLTKEGYQKHEEELEFLRTVRRKEIAEKIKIARGFGDLSENAEYDEAKNEQAQVEDRIIVLEHMLVNAKLIDESEIKTDRVTVGSRITVLDVETNEEEEYTIVGSAEADPLNGKISNESPVGNATIGHKIGDVVKVTTPGGQFDYKILKISK